MIAFATSLRARRLASGNWDYHVWLLERVVRSMLAQTTGDVRVVVGCHDIPQTTLAANPRVHFVPVNVEIPVRDFDDMVADKVVKLSAAAQLARSHGCEFVAFNDADDLVSNRIGAFVTGRRGANGWYTTSQFFYTYGGRLMRRQRIAAPASGPCAIVRGDLLTFERPPFTSEWARMIAAGGEERYMGFLERHNVEVCVLAAVGIGHYRQFMAGRGHPLEPLPFAGNVVINHKDSMSTAGGTHGYRVMSRVAALKRSVRWLPTLRYASAARRAEFSIPAGDEIPAAYRGGASVFWR